jgi:alpha-amylase
MTDRFANGDPSNDDWDGFAADRTNPRGWWGGDFQGIIDNLDYIRGMGFDAIWITPVYRQRKDGSYHGYWPWDFFDVDGHFGTMDDIRRLREELHARGMLLMIDVVANHTGDFTYAPANYFERAAPPFDNPEWFHTHGDVQDYSNQWWVENGEIGGGLDDINQDNPEARAALLDSVRWLREQTGADGLRLDTVKHVPLRFWRPYVEAAGVFTLGEVLHGGVDYVSAYQAVIPGLVDFPLYFVIERVFARHNSMLQLQELFARDDAYPRPDLLAPFVDNHDTPRFLNSAGGVNDESLAQLRAALVLAFTCRNMPVLYYGTEQAFSGAMDPENREMMVFDPEAPLYGFIARLNALRAEFPALRSGTRRELFASHTVYAYERAGEGLEPVVVVVSNSRKPQEFAVTGPWAEGTRVRDALSGTRLTVGPGGVVTGLVQAPGAVVLVRE